ncbi:putative Helicase-associated domain-containing protein [Helianthus annuus]|uniref:RNA helicase n=1 Tax=Helianthus annuus TaxID=4232 RepID=A0A251UXW6_HELAN|nr:putative Helicase-associated domain-containing protein [Helianthus annuus]KAJ0581321.1 putative Helicase-associated domain-containing protein [Helianthus annuus]KAJ0589258.1 putative Helicase-associated domain-containing protein [Helianthus annuus]KAJ0597268.1 putative Helicase-associated domain-containing protein [Helianthus annuus]KAJ0757948.1 putative Helicase-associated domain-containing protein [Helianthus annuus]
MKLRSLIFSMRHVIKNLVQLGAIVLEHGIHKLAKDGRMLVKLGIEPRLGKKILKCFENHMGREGLVLAAAMANSSSIFCRVGKDEEKQKSDCLKVQFCHTGSDLFTLLSVYRKWQCIPPDKSNAQSIDRRKLQLKVLMGFGMTSLKRFCGKLNSSLKHLVSNMKDTINDDRVRLEVSVDHNEVNVFATSEHITRTSEIVNSVLKHEGKWLQNECLEVVYKLGSSLLDILLT